MSETDLKRVDLNLLVLFKALMSERHVGRAGERLHMSQSGASYALARLRTLVGDPLFLPHPRGVHPTERAIAMAPIVEEVLALARLALARDTGFVAATAQHSFSIGATDYASFVLLPSLVAGIRAAAPGIDLRVQPVDCGTLVDDLDRGRIDVAIAIAGGPYDRIETVPLLQERLVHVARRGHPLFADRLTPEVLADVLHLLVSPRGDASGPGYEALAAMGLTRRVAVTVPHFLVAPFVLQCSDLIALLAERVARRFADVADLEIRETELDLPDWTLSFMVRRDRAHEAPLNWLQGAVVAAASALDRRPRKRQDQTPVGPPLLA